MWRAVTDAVGVAGRDALWDYPDLMPTAEDIDDPAALVARLEARARGEEPATDEMDDALARLLAGESEDAAGRPAARPTTPERRRTTAGRAGATRDPSEPRSGPSPPPQAPRRGRICRRQLWTTRCARDRRRHNRGMLRLDPGLPAAVALGHHPAVRRGCRRRDRRSRHRGSSGSSASSSAASPMRRSTRSPIALGAPETRRQALRAPHRARSAPGCRRRAARSRCRAPDGFPRERTRRGRRRPSAACRARGLADHLVRCAGRARRGARARRRAGAPPRRAAARRRADGAATSRTFRSCSPASAAEVGPFVRARAHAVPRVPGRAPPRCRPGLAALAAQLLGRPRAGGRADALMRGGGVRRPRG